MKKPKLNTKRVSVVGLGKLGLPFAVCLAKRGFKVIGVDIDTQKIEKLKTGIPPFFEPDLKSYLNQFSKRLFFTNEHKNAIIESDITFIIVATPSDKTGNFSNTYVESALVALSEEFKNKEKYHLFIINSTLMPTSTEKRLIPIIEKHSRKKLNEGFGVCYIPDFVALGKVIWDFLNPDFVLIGESNKFAGDIAEKIYKKICENNPPIHRMSIVSAEIAKMSVNTFLTLKITFANMLGNICEKIPNAQIDKITQAIGSDKRIGAYYLKAGLSFGGTCFPRDTKAFRVLLKNHSYPQSLINAVEQINNFQDKHLLETIKKIISKRKLRKIAILGLSFKPDTPVIEESPAIKLINSLLKEKIKTEIIVYDPLALEDTKKIFGEKIKYARSIKDCCQNGDIIVITNPSKEFQKINSRWIKENTFLVDCWRILTPEKFKKINYLAMGTPFTL